MGRLLRAGTRGEAGGGEEGGGAGPDRTPRQGGEPWLGDQLRLAGQVGWLTRLGNGGRLGVGSVAG